VEQDREPPGLGALAQEADQPQVVAEREDPVAGPVLLRNALRTGAGMDRYDGQRDRDAVPVLSVDPL